MTEHTNAQSSLQAGQAIDPVRTRRNTTTAYQGFKHNATGADAAFGIFLLAAGIMIFFPAAYLFVTMTMIVYASWLARLRFRLPFRIPQSWPGLDFSTPKPGQTDSFQKAQGILYLGVDTQTGEELWTTNDDARRHIFTLGTTGSGKALPLDALVLTPSGWRRNGDIAPGDAILKPDGQPGIVSSVHPQGRMKLFRVEFADGRYVECSGDHLWKVSLSRRGAPPGLAGGRTAAPGGPALLRIEGGECRVMETSDIGIMLGISDIMETRYAVHAPLCAAQPGRPDPSVSRPSGREAARRGLSSVVSGACDLAGTAAQRRDFLSGFIEAAECRVRDGFLSIPCRDEGEARSLRSIAWSLGGVALCLEAPCNDAGNGEEAPGLAPSGWSILMTVPGIEAMAAGVRGVETVKDPQGLEIVAVEPVDKEEVCLCIRVDDEEGLYVTDNFVVTHNTEFLLGLVVQPMSWGSGFLFVDGKGTPQFNARVWSLAKRFGREDDVRCINFMGVSGDSDAPSGGMPSESNTLNPFAKGTPDQLLNLLASLMGDNDKSGGDMWKNRAVQLVSSAIRVLVEMRDRGEILLDVQTIRDYLPLGTGVRRAQQPQQQQHRRQMGGRGRMPPDRFGGDDAGNEGNEGEDDLAGITEAEWADLARRPGMIELYLRSLRGEFSEASRLSLKGFFDSLPGFVLSKATQGTEQDQKTLEQYGYLSMQLTKPLGSMADDFGHIFRTPLAEVDMEDVVYNRRILVVLLPALQKDATEVKNLGRIIVAMTKSMMGYAAGSRIVGSRRDLLDSSPTMAPSPFIAVFDEAGYYMVEGLDVAAAQARSLGFCIVVGAQDIQAMKKTTPQVADSVIANTYLNAFGATVDASDTLQFIQKKTGQQTVAVSQGYSLEEGIMSSRNVERREVSFQQVDRISLQELQQLRAGDFFMVMEGSVVKCHTFFVGTRHTAHFQLNKFLKVRGPVDRAPGLDQSEEENFRDNLVAVSATLQSPSEEQATRPLEVNQMTGHLGYLSLLCQPPGEEDRDSAGDNGTEKENGKVDRASSSGEPAAGPVKLSKRPGLAEAEAVFGLLSEGVGKVNLADQDDEIEDNPATSIDIEDLLEDDIFSGGMSSGLDPRPASGDRKPAASNAGAGNESAGAAGPVFTSVLDEMEGKVTESPAAGPAYRGKPDSISDKALLELGQNVPGSKYLAQSHPEDPFAAIPRPDNDGKANGDTAKKDARQAERRKQQAEMHVARKTEDDLMPAPPSLGEAALVRKARRKRMDRDQSHRTMLERINIGTAERLAAIDREAGADERDISRMRRHIVEGGLLGRLDHFHFGPRDPAEILERIDRVIDLSARGIPVGASQGGGTGEARKEVAEAV